MAGKADAEALTGKRDQEPASTPGDGDVDKEKENDKDKVEEKPSEDAKDEAEKMEPIPEEKDDSQASV